MRILAIATLYPVSSEDYAGQARHVSFRALVAAGHEIEVIRPQIRLYQWLSRDWRRKGGRDVPAAYTLDGVRVSCPRFWRPPGNWWRPYDALLRYGPIARVARAAHAVRPFDLIYGCELMPDGVVAVRLARELGLPVMLSSIGSDAHTYPYQSRRAMSATQSTLKAADLILVEGEGALADVRRLSRETAPVHVFSRGIDLSRYAHAPPRDDKRRELGLPLDQRLIVFVGALNEGKGVRVLVEAYGRLRGKIGDVDLVCVGTGPLVEWIRSEASKHGWGDNLHLIGRRPYTEVPHILSACDVFCLPSFAEGLPKSVVEAMAAGLPIVATEVGGTPDVMQYGPCGVLVSPRDADALADALTRVLANPEEAARMGRTGREIAYAHFDTVKNAQDLLKLAEKAIARGRERMASEKGS